MFDIHGNIRFLIIKILMPSLHNCPRTLYFLYTMALFPIPTP